VEYALYTLNDRFDGRIAQQEDGQITVRLAPLEAMAEEEIGRIWNQTLLTTSVNEHAFESSAPLRNYLAQTAFSITAEAQQTLDELVASQISRRDIEHAGAGHVNINIPLQEETNPAPPYVVQKDGGAGTVTISLDPSRYLLPDMLQAVHEIRNARADFVLNRPGSALIIKLRPAKPETSLDSVVEQLERWILRPTGNAE
jgi:hypothetical protein